MATLYRITNTWTVAGGVETAQATFFILSSSTDTLSSVTAQAGSGYNAFWTSVKSLYANSTSTARVRCDQVDPVTGATIAGQDATITISAGTAAQNPLPPQCAVVITKRTAFSGPRFRGRCYLPAPATGACDANGKLVSSNQTTIQTAVGVWFNAWKIYSPTLQPVVFSRTAGGSSAISAVEIGSVFDTQRSRRGRLIESRTSTAIA